MLPSKRLACPLLACLAEESSCERVCSTSHAAVRASPHSFSDPSHTGVKQNEKRNEQTSEQNSKLCSEQVQQSTVRAEIHEYVSTSYSYLPALLVMAGVVDRRSSLDRTPLYG